MSGLALKFRDTQHCFVGGVPVILSRISFGGELGFEIYCRPHYLLRLAQAIEDAGVILGISGMVRGRYVDAVGKGLGRLGAGLSPRF